MNALTARHRMFRNPPLTLAPRLLRDSKTKKTRKHEIMVPNSVGGLLRARRHVSCACRTNKGKCKGTKRRQKYSPALIDAPSYTTNVPTLRTRHFTTKSRKERAPFTLATKEVAGNCRWRAGANKKIIPRGLLHKKK